MKKITFITVAIMLLTMLTAKAQSYSGGAGTTADPYQIATLTDLQYLSEHSTDWASDFIQTANIDATETNTWNSSAGFSPIGNSITKFTGSYNGSDYTIDCLFINRPATDYIGLFGYAYGSTVDSVDLSNVDITGSFYVGGLVGFNHDYSSVSNSYSTGSVSGTGNYVGGLVGRIYHYITVSNSYSSVSVSGDYYVGGLVGQIDHYSSVSNSHSSGSVFGDSFVGGLVGANQTSSSVSYSYSTGSVSGTNYVGGLVGSKYSHIFRSYSTSTVLGDWCVGGLVGYNHSLGTINISYSTGSVSGTDCVGGLVGGNLASATISNSYSTGSVSGTTNIGGLVGDSISSTVSNSFWDTETSGMTTSNGGTGKTTAEMQDITTFTSIATIGLDAAWDFTGTPNDDVGTNDNWSMPICGTNYPVLSWQIPQGSGTTADPYQIATLNDLRWLSENSCIWDSCFIQTANIDATVTNTWNSGAGFSPIGNFTTQFTGTYNGSDYTIDGLFINRPSADYIGLFGYVSGTMIDSLGLSNVDITGQWSVGGLVGLNFNSSVSNSYSTGAVSGTTTVGGFVGWNSNSSVSNSYFTGSVSAGNSNVGGLVGDNLSSSVSYSYSTGLVSGPFAVGGLVGYNTDYSLVSNSYSSVSVTGTNYIGGLVGDNVNESNVFNSYSTGSVSGTGAYVGGLVGENDFSYTTNSFWDTQTSSMATSSGGTGKTTAEMQDLCTYLNAGWDFAVETSNGTDDYWVINSTENSAYPALAWQNITHTGICCGFTHPIYNLTETVEVCSGESYTFPDETTQDNIITQVGYTSYLQTVGNLCDSIIETTVNVNTVNITVTQDLATLTAEELGVEYQWLDCDNEFNPIDGETNQMFEAASNGSYAVEITDGDCSDISDCFDVTTILIEDSMFESSITAFPNPTNGLINIDLGNSYHEIDIIITDAQGRVVKNLSFSNTPSFDLEFDGLPGVYFVLITADSKTANLRLIKK